MLISLIYWTAMAVLVPIGVCIGIFIGTALVRTALAIIDAVLERVE